ncbi:MAG: RNA polymerase sigma factor [Bacteroidales bacterium]|nr:RNA polymerase sigma factor [Bacteroidales bacterium]
MKPEDSHNHLFVRFFEKENRKLIGYINNYIDVRLYGLEAEDIIQEIALNLYSKADISGHIGNIAAYIYRAVRNKIIDLYRSRKVTVSMETLTDHQHEKKLLNTLMEEEEEPSICQSEVLQQKLLMSIDKLNPVERELIRKTEYEGFTFQELADEWNLPIGTLLARKHRALGKLRKMLQDDFALLNH